MDEVYAQIMLLPEHQSEPTSPDQCPPEPPRPTVHHFCKILTASDTSTHGGFSVLRRHANECLPPLAGGASTEHTLSSEVGGILEALKSNDWITRKAASLALVGMAATTGSLLRPFRSSCIRSLEGCRFDKVKPVRDAVIRALECWKSLSRADSPEPSEAGSSTKENFSGADYPDIACASDGGWKDTSFRKARPVSAVSGNSTCSIKERTPFTCDLPQQVYLSVT